MPNEKKKPRTLWELSQATPLYESVLRGYYIRINTEEAATLVMDGRAEFRTREKDGQRAQIYFYGKKRYLWSAGITTDSFNDPLPALVQKPRAAQAA